MKGFKSMWFYCILVFGVAIMLIVISAISQTKIAPSITSAEQVAKEEENSFNKTIGQSISQLSDVNDSLHKEITKKQEQIDSLTKERNDVKATSDSLEALITARSYADDGNYKEAYQSAVAINYDKLSDAGKKIYDNLKSRLTRHGYNL